MINCGKGKKSLKQNEDIRDPAREKSKKYSRRTRIRKEENRQE